MNTAIGTGISTADDGSVAGEAAAADARSDLPDDRVDFCQVFCPPEYDYETVVGAVRSVVGTDAALIGCSCTEPFTDETVGDGVTVGLVASDTLEFFTGVGTGLRDNVSKAVREAVAGLPDEVDGYPYAAAINLHDGLAGVGEKLALVCQQKLGPQVSIAGGAASDDHHLDATYVFHDDEVVEDGIVLALVAAKERPPIVAVAHGHEPLSEPVTVTAADGPQVHEFDGEPAYEVWKDAVRESVHEEFDVELDELAPDSQLLQRLLCEYEFGIDQGERYKMRWPWVEDESGTLHFAVDVPEGTVMRVMHGRPEQQIESARETVERALDAAGDVPMAGGFIYDCACRGIVLEDEFSTAVDEMADELQLPFTGFETYGEVCIGPGGFSGFHNTTTVALLLPE